MKFTINTQIRLESLTSEYDVSGVKGKVNDY